jgi:hypothetical protein
MPKLRLVSEGLRVVPIPVRTMLCGLPFALSVITIEDFRGPGVVGTKIGLRAQFSPVARVLGQFWFKPKSSLSPPVMVKLLICKGAVPLFVNVIVR